MDGCLASIVAGPSAKPCPCPCRSRRSPTRPSPDGRCLGPLLLPLTTCHTGPLVISIQLKEEQLADGNWWKVLSIKCNGMPIHVTKVRSMLALGHPDKEVKVEPARRPTNAAAAAAGPGDAAGPSSGPSSVSAAAAAAAVAAKMEHAEQQGMTGPMHAAEGEDNPQPARSPVYGCFGHGTFIGTYGAAYHAFWHGWWVGPRTGMHAACAPLSH